jgi:hypothetical protein
MPNNTIPPLGVKPRWLHNEIRLEELSGAIYRYLNSGRAIDTKWVNEYNELIKLNRGES